MSIVFSSSLSFSKTTLPSSDVILRLSTLFAERLISPLLGFGYKLYSAVENSFTSEMIIELQVGVHDLSYL